MDTYLFLPALRRTFIPAVFYHLDGFILFFTGWSYTYLETSQGWVINLCFRAIGPFILSFDMAWDRCLFVYPSYFHPSFYGWIYLPHPVSEKIKGLIIRKVPDILPVSGEYFGPGDKSQVFPLINHRQVIAS